MFIPIKKKRRNVRGGLTRIYALLIYRRVLDGSVFTSIMNASFVPISVFTANAGNVYSFLCRWPTERSARPCSEKCYTLACSSSSSFLPLLNSVLDKCWPISGVNRAATFYI